MASVSAKQMAKRELKWNIKQAEKEGNGARSVPQNVPEARCQKVKHGMVLDMVLGHGTGDQGGGGVRVRG